MTTLRALLPILAAALALAGCNNYAYRKVGPAGNTNRAAIIPQVGNRLPTIDEIEARWGPGDPVPVPRMRSWLIRREQVAPTGGPGTGKGKANDRSYTYHRLDAYPTLDTHFLALPKDQRQAGPDFELLALVDEQGRTLEVTLLWLR